jgi:hypothetical protein
MHRLAHVLATSTSRTSPDVPTVITLGGGHPVNRADTPKRMMEGFTKAARKVRGMRGARS